MKKNFTISVFVMLMFSLSIRSVTGQYPGSGQVPLSPEKVPQFVDFLPHFAGLRVNAKAGGDLIIRAVETRQVAVSKGTVLDNGIVGTDAGAGVGNYFVYQISKDGGTTWTLPLWPAFTIEAQRGNPLNIKVENKLNGLIYKDVNIAADQTIMMSGVPTTGDPMTDPYEGPIPIALHLHGGEVQSTSDGGPYAWFTPDYLLKGKGWENGVGEVLTYPNKQEAATLWYHEHSQLGLTRINVYAGMAGFYFLRGPDEETHKLPGWSGDDFVQEVAPEGKVADALHPDPYLPEIEIVIQDRMFDQNGQLYYAVDAVNPDVHPFWAPEFFGDIITVNGRTWPYLSVAPRKYRFHLLDGSNARFYNLWLKNMTEGKSAPAIVQVGTDGGLLDGPVRIDPALGQKLLMGPGERADVVIDFTNLAPGTVLTLMNDANAPYPDGDPVAEGFTDRIMQFIVNGKMADNKIPDKVGKDKSLVLPVLRSKPLIRLTNFAGKTNITPDVKRQLTLNEVQGPGGPLMVLLNNSRYEEIPDMPDMFGAPTEKPVEGTTEMWQLINTTMDAHPMHMHLVQFQLVNRQKFDIDAYMNDYIAVFESEKGGAYSTMPGMFMGAEGPPFLYDTKNSDGAIGGNLPVTPYLKNYPVVPAQPNERGWKDVIKAYPGEITTYMVRFAPTDLPLAFNRSKLVYSFDPSKGPGYVWHCHIVEHEDNDMMRPLNVQANPTRQSLLFASSKAAPVENNLLDGFTLGQNSPNPFSSETEIRFSIPYDCHVQLKLFTLAGVEVSTLIDADALAGEQIARISAGNLSNGMYIYQLKAGLFMSTRTLIINR